MTLAEQVGHLVTRLDQLERGHRATFSSSPVTRAATPGAPPSEAEVPLLDWTPELLGSQVHRPLEQVGPGPNPSEAGQHQHTVEAITDTKSGTLEEKEENLKESLEDVEHHHGVK